MQGDMTQLRQWAAAIDLAWELGDKVVTRSAGTDREMFARSIRNDLERLHSDLLDYIDEAKKGTAVPFRQPLK